MMPPTSELPPHLVDAALAMLGSGRPGTLPIHGRSMEPTLPDGSQIVVDFSDRSFRRGDLVVFRQSREVVVHRSLGRATFPDGRPFQRTRGDRRARWGRSCCSEGTVCGATCGGGAPSSTRAAWPGTTPSGPVAARWRSASSAVAAGSGGWCAVWTAAFYGRWTVSSSCGSTAGRRRRPPDLRLLY